MIDSGAHEVVGQQLGQLSYPTTRVIFEHALSQCACRQMLVLQDWCGFSGNFAQHVQKSVNLVPCSSIRVGPS